MSAIFDFFSWLWEMFQSAFSQLSSFVSWLSSPFSALSDLVSPLSDFVVSVASTCTSSIDLVTSYVNQMVGYVHLHPWGALVGYVCSVDILAQYFMYTLVLFATFLTLCIACAVLFISYQVVLFIPHLIRVTISVCSGGFVKP